jgi:4-hydroxy-tetrahydrodipicolinate reductase
VRIAADVAPEMLARAIAIDFSVPRATMALLRALPPAAGGLVIGTTGFSDEQQARIVAVARTVPVLASPNMSLGVNLLYHLAEVAARRLGRRYNVEIVEAHHRHKKDAPSGTARRLGEIVAGALGLSYETAAVHGREGIRDERAETEIGVHALRGGDIVGDHLVMFAGEGERLELRHVAQSRTTFAQGAIAAAKWLAGRRPGLYSMSDVLGM